MGLFFFNLLGYLLGFYWNHKSKKVVYHFRPRRSLGEYPALQVCEFITTNGIFHK